MKREQTKKRSQREKPDSRRRQTTWIIGLAFLCVVLLAGWIWIASYVWSRRSAVQTYMPGDSTEFQTPAMSKDTVNEFEDFASDTIDGWLKLRLNQELVMDSLGEPESKGDDIYWGALGTYVQEWNYPSQGIILQMESSEENGDKSVLMITITAPCKKATSRGISIGSKKEEVTKKYSGKINNDFTDNEEILVGSIYGGVIFFIEDGTVSRIFIGAAAE